MAAALPGRRRCTDRRVNFVALTPAGQSNLAEAAAVHTRNLERVFAGFTRNDISALDALLDRLRGTIDHRE